jgi:broad specificity phosphatase PhoE
MRVLDIRRHTMRRKPGDHLSHSGIKLARQVGQQSGPFNLVVTSTIPRAIETAIAMGFEIDETIDGLGLLPDSVMMAVGWPRRFDEIAPLLSGDVAGFATSIAGLWRNIAMKLPPSEHGLVVTHGLIIELGILASMPTASQWGGPIGYCEGARLTYSGVSQGGEVLRVPSGFQLVEN